MNEGNGIIYMIKNKVNDKVYIGQTRVSLKERMRHHFSKWETCSKLKKAIETLGIENFEYNILEEIPVSKLNEREVFYIKKYNSVKNGYNCKEGNSRFRGRKIHSIKNLEPYVIQDYKNRIPIETIANKYNIAITSIYNILDRNNIEKGYNKGGFNSKAKIKIDQLIYLLSLGYSNPKIAKILGVNRSSVRRMILRHKNIIFPRVSDNFNIKVENIL